MPVVNEIDFFELRKSALLSMMEFCNWDELDFSYEIKERLTGGAIFHATFNKNDKNNIIMEQYDESPHNGDILNYITWKTPLNNKLIDKGIAQMRPSYKNKYLETLVPDPVEFFNPSVFNQNNP